jgi:hypothetical protein
LPRLAVAETIEDIPFRSTDNCRGLSLWIGQRPTGYGRIFAFQDAAMAQTILTKSFLKVLKSPKFQLAHIAASRDHRFQVSIVFHSVKRT